MRTLSYLSLCLALAACGDDTQNGDQAGTGDLTTNPLADLAGADLAGADLAMSGGADMSLTGDAGGVGSPCMSACDCQTGLACAIQQGTCIQLMNPVYCCGSSTCPAGDLCQDDQGVFRRCGNLDGGFGVPDGGDFCRFINCKQGGAQRCMMAGCSMCMMGMGQSVCAR